MEHDTCDARNARHGHFPGQRRVAQDLRGCVEVAERVCGDDHDGLLGVAVVGMVVVMLVMVRGVVRGVRGKGIKEEEFGELALAEGNNGRLLLEVSLVPHTGFVDRVGKRWMESWLALLLPSPESLCICKHWPRYIKLSLILPASASVAPAVLAFLARSEPSV